MTTLVFGQPRLQRVLIVIAVATSVCAQAPDPPASTPSPPAETLLKALGDAIGGRAATGSDAAPRDSDAPGAAAPLPTDTVEGTPGRLEVHVRNLDLATLLELLSRQARANIVASTSVSAKVSANLYGVTLEQALDAILIPNKLTHARIDGAIFVGTAEEIAAMMPAPTTEVFTLRYISPAEAAGAVTAILGDAGRVIEGGPDAGQKSGDEKGGGSASANYIIVTAHPDELAAIRKVLDNIDRRPQQVLIEATVLRATLNEENALGIDFVGLSGVDFQAVGATSVAAANLRPGEVPPLKFEQTLLNVNTDFASAVPGGGFTFGFIKNNLATFVRALEEVTDVVVVANPKIVALNRQEGEVIVGRRDGYITTTVTETAAVQKVEFLETGTQIRFRPFINDDGSVRLFVHPKDSNGGLTSSNLPFEETTEAQADVLINDGDTVLIGGLFRERTTSSRSQIPLVGDIPGLGILAGNQSDGTTREEVIILLTVRVLKNDAVEKAANESLIEDIERTRVGLRRNLFGVGRERLAQAYYREALDQLEQGNRDAALFNARLALHHQPKHLGAMRIEERITRERAWEDDGTRMRTLIWQLIDPTRTATPHVRPPFERPDLDDIAPPDQPPTSEDTR